MNELEVGFQQIIVCSGSFGRSPEKRVVVWKGGEEHAEEEACCCRRSVNVCGCATAHVRPMIMKVANDPDPP